jgi:hypothetical protein
MKHIEKLDAAREQEITFGELGVHRTFYWAYQNSHEAENEVLNFDDVVWEQDVPAIVEDCRRFGINRFTISCGMSSMAELIWTFEQHSCCLIGMTQVNSRFTETTADWEEKRRLLPAFELRVLPV